jgi:nucleoid-associated protein EbfC
MQSMEEMIQAAQKAAETIQGQMNEMQAKLDGLEVEGQSGGGLVKVRATAKGRILGVTIDESLMQPSEKQMVEDLVTAAFNDARDKADRVSGEEMKKLQGGLGLPPGFNLPGMG